MFLAPHIILNKKYLALKLTYQDTCIYLTVKKCSFLIVWLYFKLIDKLYTMSLDHEEDNIDNIYE